MKKLFLLSFILFGCSYTTYVPHNLGYDITTFDKEVATETQTQYNSLDVCGKDYVDYFETRIYEVMASNEYAWKQCHQNLNYAQRKIWSKYWAVEGWSHLYKAHAHFCEWRAGYIKDKKDPMKDGSIAWIMVTGYLMERNLDICSTSGD